MTDKGSRITSYNVCYTKLLRIQSVRFTASEQLEQFVESKVGKLDQYFDGIVSAEVILRLEKSDVTENKIAEVKLNLPGGELFSEEQVV